MALSPFPIPHSPHLWRHRSPSRSKVVGQEIAVGGVLERGLDDAVPAQAMNEVARRRGDEAKVMGHAVAESKAEKIAFEQRRQRVRRLIDRPFLKASVIAQPADEETCRRVAPGVDGVRPGENELDDASLDQDGRGKVHAIDPGPFDAGVGNEGGPDPLPGGAGDPGAKVGGQIQRESGGHFLPPPMSGVRSPLRVMLRETLRCPPQLMKLANFEAQESALPSQPGRIVAVLPVWAR